ncbi:MAG: HAMP domain-containing sensor histidine kinase [Planctomycetota bacterium]
MSQDSLSPRTGACTCEDVNGVPTIGCEAGPAARMQQLQQELIACQRLALLGNMAAMVTHEFNNLLTPILARAEAALGETDPAYLRKTLERIAVQAQRAMTVTQRLLELAHGESQPVEDCSLADAVREALATLTRPLEKDGIELHFHVPEELRVAAHPDLLCQVLLNLLLNARRAMLDQPGMLAITAAACGEHVQIDVRDNGRGLSAAHLNDKVNPFLAADPHAQPNDWQQVGLGLSVCRMIAHHHGATLRGLTNPDGGCTFQLLWPKASAFRRESPGRC